MDLATLDVTLTTQHLHLLVDVVNYITTGLTKVTSVSDLRDGSHLVKIIVTFESCNRWQEPRVVQLFFQLKNETITPYAFINSWLDQYYHCGLEIVREEFRLAQEDELATVTILLLNVLYSQRTALSPDLKLCLEAAWMDLGRHAESAVLWMRTRAMSMTSLVNQNHQPANGLALTSCAQQLFSGQTVYYHENVTQRMALMVQQKLVNKQAHRLEQQDAVIQKHLVQLNMQLADLNRENQELKSCNNNLLTEIKWQKCVNEEQTEVIAKLKLENERLKQMLKTEGSEETRESVGDENGHEVVERNQCESVDSCESILDQKSCRSSMENLESSCELNHDDTHLNNLNVQNLELVDDKSVIFSATKLNNLNGSEDSANDNTSEDTGIAPHLSSSSEDGTGTSEDELLIDISNSVSELALDERPSLPSPPQETIETKDLIDLTSWTEIFPPQDTLKEQIHSHQDTYSNDHQEASLGTKTICNKRICISPI